MDGRQLIPLLLMICFSVCDCNIPIERISASGTNETNEKGIWDWITGGGDKKSICDGNILSFYYSRLVFIYGTFSNFRTMWSSLH